jgi:hypothetical protein
MLLNETNFDDEEVLDEDMEGEEEEGDETEGEEEMDGVEDETNM